MKGIVLAGGTGTRLHPTTRGINKHFMPVYDKPMIYYSISALMLAGINDILIICNKEDQSAFIRLLGNGEQFGVRFSFTVQDKPDGLAQAFVLGEDFIGNESVCLVLGDNIFFGPNFRSKLLNAANQTSGATVFGYQVKDPGRFGVVGFDDNGVANSIEEKPKAPKSNYAVTGLYFYDNEVVNIAKSIKPSSRGELEISCINKHYMGLGKLNVQKLARGFSWYDAGTHESLFDATQFIVALEKRQGFKIACLEEIAFLNKWINREQLLKAGKKMEKNTYGQYLLNLALQK